MKHLNQKLIFALLFTVLFSEVAIIAQTSGNSEKTREIMQRYLESNHSDLSMMADDVVFTNMATGEEHKGTEEVSNMLNYVYHVAFDAEAELKNLIVDGNRAVLEGEIVGKHIGDFAGVPATNKDVRIPLCVVYDFENDQIKRARIYFEVPALMEQLK
ncbi:MAG: hypothetical protein EHM47_15605 [Ignavibacteriales bacterium]|nr:MAG: hypothetical protein EHM47_15605 [Ignavibacteriales bacterium]